MLCKGCEVPLDLALDRVSTHYPSIAVFLVRDKVFELPDPLSAGLMKRSLERCEKNPELNAGIIYDYEKLRGVFPLERAKRFAAKVCEAAPLQCFSVSSALLPKGYLRGPSFLFPDRVAGAFEKDKPLPDEEKKWVETSRAIVDAAKKYTAAETQDERTKIIEQEKIKLFSNLERENLAAALSGINKITKGTFSLTAFTNFPNPGMYEKLSLPTHQLVFQEEDKFSGRRFDVSYGKLKEACAKSSDEAYKVLLAGQIEADALLSRSAKNLSQLQAVLRDRSLGGKDSIFHFLSVGFKDQTLPALTRRAKVLSDSGAHLAGIGTEYAPLALRSLAAMGQKQLPPIHPVTKKEIIESFRKTLIDAVKSGKEHVIFDLDVHGNRLRGSLLTLDSVITAADLHALLTTRIEAPGSPFHRQPVCSAVKITLLFESCYFGKLGKDLVDSGLLNTPETIKDLLIIGISPDEPGVVIDGRELPGAFDEATKNETLTELLGYLSMRLKNKEGKTPSLGEMLAFAVRHSILDTKAMETPTIYHIADSNRIRTVTTLSETREIKK